ncbi:MAG: FAD-dependent oxidoreductase, partial [Candidatus Hydrogenedentales bacterium]
MAVGVIGAGPAGITAAYQLAKAGVDVHVFEAGDCVGGLARSFRLWNQTVDLGPHRFFSTDARVNALWLEVVGGDYTMVKRFTRILYGDRLFHYPLQPLNALSQLGVVEAARCVASFAREKVFPDSRVSRDTFEGWVTSRFGQRLFEIFFKTYSEKLWGISCDALDADFAAQRIKKLNLFEAVANALRGAKGAAKHRTLVDEFAYPLGGTGSVYTRMADAVSVCGGRVHLNTRVQRVLTKANRAYAIELESGEVCEFDTIVSSMPISLLTARLPDVPEAIGRAANSLKFRNTVVVYLKIDADGLFPDQWIYVHSDGARMGRITNFRNWVPSLYGEERGSILA